MLELGGNITLVGFREESKPALVIVKKIVGQYARKMSDLKGEFHKLSISLKKVHSREKSEKYEFQAHVVADKDYNSDVVDRNLFYGLDKVLANILREMQK